MFINSPIDIAVQVIWWWWYWWCLPLFSSLPSFLSLSSLAPPGKSSNLYNHTRGHRWNANADIAWNQLGQTSNSKSESSESRSRSGSSIWKSSCSYIVSQVLPCNTERGQNQHFIWRNETCIENQRWECLSLWLIATFSAAATASASASPTPSPPPCSFTLSTPSWWWDMHQSREIVLMKIMGAPTSGSNLRCFGSMKYCRYWYLREGCRKKTRIFYGLLPNWGAGGQRG